MSLRLIESTQPFKVRASCGHIVIRRMREATAGVPYTPETILDAPNGRACEMCEKAGCRCAWGEACPIHAADQILKAGRD